MLQLIEVSKLEKILGEKASPNLTALLIGMAMIMSMQRLKESGGREGGSWTNICRQDSDGSAARSRRSVGCKSKLRRTHLVKAEREREGEKRLSWEGREDLVCAS